MKITQLVSGLKLPLSNEENDFVKKYGNTIRIYSLGEHAQWIAQNLVRKGVYIISNDSNTLVKQVNDNIL